MVVSSPATVVCVLRAAPGLYNARYVRALRAGLQQHSPSLRLACVTDRPDEVAPYVDQVVSMEHEWRRWWCLVEWFKPGLFSGPVIAMGLDTLITGDITHLAGFSGFAMINDFYSPRLLASGVMLWQGDMAAPLYERFRKDGPEHVMASYPRMDPWLRIATTQVGLAPVTRIQNVFPNQVFSYKAHARKGCPEGARIVCGHGQPQFSDPVAGWAHTLWSQRAHTG